MRGQRVELFLLGGDGPTNCLKSLFSLQTRSLGQISPSKEINWEGLVLRMTSCCTLLPPSGVFVFSLRLAGANFLEEISLILTSVAEQLWGAHLLVYVAGVLGHGSQL